MKQSAAKKLLVIIDLNGTICHFNKNKKAFNNIGMYKESGDNQALPIFKNKEYQIY